MPDPLLELPAVCIRLPALHALELGARLLELLLGPLRVDLPRGHCVVHEGDCAVLLDLEEAWAGRELLHLGVPEMDARVPGPQHRDERRVPREHIRIAHHWLILHGRRVCKARRPECWRCPAAPWCQYPDKTPAPG